MAAATRTRRASSFRWNSDTLREPLSSTDLESSNETSADDFSDVDERTFRGGRYESDLSDVGEECDDRRRFRDRGVMTKKVSYDSDSCLTPRSRRTLRKSLSTSSTEPWPSGARAPALDTIFSPTHEILHPLQSLRLERSLSSKDSFPTKVYRTTVTFETFALAKPLLPSTPGKFDSYKFRKPTAVDEEKLEQKQSLIASANEEKSATHNVVVIVVDAEKNLTFVALDWAINVAVRPGDEIVLLGVLKHIISPMGLKLVANTDPLRGINRELLQSEVDKTTECFQNKVCESGRREECEKKQVKLSVHIAPGARARTVIVRELRALGATYAIFDRKAMRNRKYYGKNLSCHAVRMRRNGHSTQLITKLVPSTKARSQTSDITSVSSSMSTDRTSSNESPKSPTLWRRLTSFRSSRRSSRRSVRSSPRSTHGSDITSPPVSELQDVFHQDLDQLKSPKSPKSLKPLESLDAPMAEAPSADAYLCKRVGSQRSHLAAISVAIAPAIRAN